MRRTGSPVETVHFGGEGIVITAALGEDLDDDGVTRYVMAWGANENEDEVDVTDTRDYVAADDRVYGRNIAVGVQLQGTMRFKFDGTDDASDLIAAFRTGTLIQARLYITRGRDAITGPPAIPAVKQAYFECPEVKVTLNIPEAEAKALRMLEVAFKTNGPYTYVREDAA